jgi:hypothetical protein|tara:strand:- start:527 stop:838 length:312 start_codon:yes stop_codon:yes gene_type:complete
MTDITHSLEIVLTTAKKGLAKSRESTDYLESTGEYNDEETLQQRQYLQDIQTCIDHVTECTDMLTRLGKFYRYLEPKRRMQLLGPHQHPDTYIPFPDQHTHPD